MITWRKDTRMSKDRIYYWSTVIVFASMILYTYSEYKDLEKLVEDSHRIYNRQLYLQGQSNKKTVDRLNKALEEKNEKLRSN
jgi:hypothetical protein